MERKTSFQICVIGAVRGLIPFRRRAVEASMPPSKNPASVKSSGSIDFRVPKSFLARWQGSLWQKLVAGLCCLLLLNTLVSDAAPVPSDKPTNYPEWWFSSGVIAPLNPNNQSPSWNGGSYPVPDDFSAANLGQLKQMATQAAAELNANLPGGAGDIINNLITTWNSTPQSGVVRDDHATVNLGQLKAVAQPFYNQLIAAGYTNAYPWANPPQPADDFSAANLGQLKYLFSFDLTYSSTGDPSNGGSGIPDWWAIAAGLNPNDPSIGSMPVTNPALTVNGIPMTYLQAYQAGTNPVTAATPSSGNSPPPPTSPLQTLPTTTYVAIDVSSQKTTQSVLGVAIDDQDDVGFMYPSASGNGMTTSTFQNGQYGSTDTTFPSASQAPQSFTWYVFEGVFYAPFTASFSASHFYTSCNASGYVAGYTVYWATNWGVPPQPGFSRIFFATGSNSFAEFWPGSDVTSPELWDLGFLGYFGYASPPASVGANLGNGMLMAGPIGYSLSTVSPPTAFTALASGGGPVVSYFGGSSEPAYTPTQFSPAGASAGSYTADQTNPPSQTQYAVCTGLTPTSIGRFIPFAIDDNARAIGDDPTISDPNDSISVCSGTISTRLGSKLPQQYAAVIRFPRPQQRSTDYTSHLAIGLNEAWINTAGDVIVNAEVNAGSPGYNWVPCTLLWRNAMGSGSDISFVTFPGSVTTRQQFNASACFAATIATPPPAQSPNFHIAAALLVPVEFRLLNGATQDFDGNVPTTLTNPDLFPDNAVTNNLLKYNTYHDIIGPNPPGGALVDDGGYGYEVSVLMMARVPSIPGVSYTWDRDYLNRSVCITKQQKADGTLYWWVNSANFTPDLPTGLPDGEPDGYNPPGTDKTVVPSPKQIIYFGDAPGMNFNYFSTPYLSPGNWQGHQNIITVNNNSWVNQQYGDYAYSETVFTYTVYISLGSSQVSATIKVGQTICAERTENPPAGAKLYTGIRNDINTSNIPNLKIDAPKIKSIVNDNLEITIQPSENFP